MRTDSSSSPADLVIRGGTVVTGSGTARAAVVVRGGRISAVCEDDSAPRGEREFDATGKLVFPGPIDAHIHHRNLTEHEERLGEVSAVAALGGTTTVIPFYASDEKLTLAEQVQAGIEEGSSECVIDFGIHFRILRPDFKRCEEIPAAIAAGAPSVKLSLGYVKRGRSLPDDHLAAYLERTAAAGGISMIHAENGHWIDYLENRLVAAGEVRPEDFSRSRPAEAEQDATNRVIAMNSAMGGRLFIVHVTTHLAHHAIRKARRRGQEVYGETCPQYLLLTDEEMARQGPLARIGPPLRGRKDNEDLWRGLVEGSLQTVGSDHAAYRRAAKEPGWSNIFQAPFGAPGAATFFPLLYSEGVAAGRLSLETLARVTSENVARIFGIYPQKGSITVGADADLLIVDPDAAWEIHAEDVPSRVDYTLYEGWKVRGRPVASFQRGEPVLENGQVRRPAGSGRFVPGRLPSGRLVE